MVLRLPLLLLLAAAAATSAPPPRKRHHVASLLRKRWDFKSASDEAMTEWNIVQRRYYMVDMELADLTTKLATVLPVNPDSNLSQPPPYKEDLARVSAKVEKLAQNLDAADKDQDTSDNTFSSMAVDVKLGATEKDTLRTEHLNEHKKAEALTSLAQTALVHARALVSIVSKLAVAAPKEAEAAPERIADLAKDDDDDDDDDNPFAPKNKTSKQHWPKHWGDGLKLVKGGNSSNTTAGRALAAAAVPARREFDQFKENTVSFRTQREAFEYERKRSSSRLLSLGKRFSKVLLKET